MEKDSRIIDKKIAEAQVVCDIAGRDILPGLPMVEIEEVKEAKQAQPRQLPFDL